MAFIEQVTAPAVLPVTVAEARQQCALYDDRSHDSLLYGYISAATSRAEAFCSMALIERTMRLTLDAFDYTKKRIPINVYPVISVDSIKYDDADGVEQTWDASNYDVNAGSRYPFVYVTGDYPVTASDLPNKVRIAFTAGYSGASADLSIIPADIKLAILLMVYEMWQNRGESIVGTSYASTKYGMESLLAPYRAMHNEE
jgi:uncharacterized phiE125 gp8 family phage protein